jgi:hypothetical protein
MATGQIAAGMVFLLEVRVLAFHVSYRNACDCSSFLVYAIVLFGFHIFNSGPLAHQMAQADAHRHAVLVPQTSG